MKQRAGKLLVLVALVALIAAGCGSDKKTTATASSSGGGTSFAAGTTMARIQQAGRIKVGVKFDQRGFGLKNPTTGQVEGFDVEIAKLIVAAIGPNVQIEFVESVSKNREPFIQDGTVDMVVATYTINDARKQVIDFAGPYFVTHQDIMVKSDDNSINSVTDLNGKKVCTAKGSTSEKNLVAKAPQADVTLFDTYSQCAEAMTDGRVVAVTTDAPILAGLVSDSSGAFKLVEAPFSDEPYGIGIKKDDAAFRTFINDRLEAIFGNGDWAKAFEKTLGAIGLKTPEPPTPDRYTVTPPAPSTTAGASSGTGSSSSSSSSSGSSSSSSSATTTTAAN
jgi:glutamate transport system substrate-binding protein